MEKEVTSPISSNQNFEFPQKRTVFLKKKEGKNIDSVESSSSCLVEQLQTEG